MKNKIKVIGNIYCAGVYGMRCKDSKNYLYIGSAIEINDALSRHLYNLKRGLYTTNKAVLQKYYDMGELVFEIIKESCHDKISEMTFEQKESLQEALSVLEEFYIELYKETVCNTQRRVTKHSSNKDEFSTIKRSRSNTGSRNPNCRHDERIIAEILWLKINGYKPREIEKYYKGIIKKNYISAIGVQKWIHLEPIKPDFIKNKEAESTAIESTSSSATAIAQ